MRLFVCFLLLATARVKTVDEVYQVGGQKWGYGPEIGLNQRAGHVSLQFETENRSDRVRVALMRRDDMEKLRAGLPHGVIAVTDELARGELNYPVPTTGDYVVVIDNQARTPAAVHIRLWLDFSQPGPAVTRLSPRRQFTVIVISFAVFFAIVSYSARRLLRAAARRS